MTAAIILAGGKGTRLAGLHPNCPKPLIPVAGQPFLLGHPLVGSSGLPPFRLFDRPSGDDDRRLVPSHKRLAPDVTRQCQLERTPLGTGGGIVNCLSNT